MSESDGKTYCQRNKDVILKRAKYYWSKNENGQKRLRDQAFYLKTKKIKRENMEERDTVICLRKRNKN